VLVVDDIAGNRQLAAACLRHDDYRVSFASSASAALEAVKTQHPDLVLMDVMMPGIDGIEACRLLKQDPATRLVPVVLVTALLDTESRIRGIDAGADDFLSKPFNQHELRARVRSLIRIKRFTDDLDSAAAVLSSLALTIEARDPYTDGHCQRLAAYGTALGRRLSLPQDDLTVLARGAYLHDVGKIGIPDAVLLKKGVLTAVEYEEMKQHTIIGDRLCAELRMLRRVRPIVRSHHERLDGSGYPDGLVGDAIPLLAQIIGVVDVYDAVVTERPYKPARPSAVAYAELRAEVAKGWRSAELVNALIEIGLRGQLADGCGDLPAAVTP
jgi:putative two-component system response regulator